MRQLACGHRRPRRPQEDGHPNQVAKQTEHSRVSAVCRAMRAGLCHEQRCANTIASVVRMMLSEDSNHRTQAMINGAHVILYSKDAEADRNFFKTVLNFHFVDVHNGWLIFKLPPSELAVHPSDENDMHELYLMTDDLDVEVAALKRSGVSFEETTQQAWGRITRLNLPGGGRPRTLRAALRASLNGAADFLKS
ncbi:MAG: VOC family protein [Caulobacteraceae bacterium]